MEIAQATSIRGGGVLAAAAGAALLCGGGVARSFVSTPTVVNGAASADPATAIQSSVEFGGKTAHRGFGTASAGCGLAAIAGVAAISRRRTQRNSKYRYEDDHSAQPPKLLVDWQVEPLKLVPGSQAMLETMNGWDVEMGEGAWDPMGFSKLYDRNFDFDNRMTWPHVQWLREAEIKHGRVCMLAVIGMVVQQFYQIPGYPNEADWTEALNACYTSKMATLGVVQISIFTMFVEGRFYPGDSWVGQMDREPGDLGFDPLGFTKKPGFDLKKEQLKELKNGRLAMIGVASLASNHVFPGSVPMLTGMYAVPQDGLKTSSASSTSLCGNSLPGVAAASAVGKTTARYTTQVILPSLTWLKTGLFDYDLAPTELRAKTIGGNDVLVGKDEYGKLFCVANLCPHIGTPMSEGADVIGDVIVCPLHGSSFSTKTGELIDWCPSPPIIGPLTGLVVDRKNLLIFDIRKPLFGGELEVLVDTNAKRAYEADYWKGILDAQGKNDGTYY